MVDRQYGSYTLDTYPVLSGRIGFEYVYNHQKEWGMRTGIYLDLFPFYSIGYAFLEKDFPKEYYYEYFYDRFKENSKLVFTIPLLVERKLQLEEELFFYGNVGFDFTLLSSGDVGNGHYFVSEELNEERQVFALREKTAAFFIYPSFRISPGIYIVSKKVLYQIGFTYKKSLVRYLKGDYQFGNLDESNPTRGDFKMTGDFLGLGVTVFLKKKAKQHHKKSKSEFIY